MGRAFAVQRNRPAQASQGKADYYAASSLSGRGTRFASVTGSLFGEAEAAKMPSGSSPGSAGTFSVHFAFHLVQAETRHGLRG